MCQQILRLMGIEDIDPEKKEPGSGPKFAMKGEIWAVRERGQHRESSRQEKQQNNADWVNSGSVIAEDWLPRRLPFAHLLIHLRACDLQDLSSNMARLDEACSEQALPVRSIEFSFILSRLFYILGAAKSVNFRVGTKSKTFGLSTQKNKDRTDTCCLSEQGQRIESSPV
jgi:hypothetical protein